MTKTGVNWPRLSSFGFILGVSLFFAIILNLSLWRFVLTKITLNGLLSYLFALTIPLVLILGLGFIFQILLWPKIYKPILSFLFLVSSFGNYAMFQYGVFIDSDMIRNFLETNQTEVLEYVSLNLIFWLTLTGLGPILLTVKAQVAFRPFWAEFKIRLLGIIICVFGLLSVMGIFYKPLASFGRNNKEITRLINPTNYIYATIRYFQKKSLANKPFQILDGEARIKPRQTQKPLVFVLIVGESARGQNFALNGYPKNTNPRLRRQDALSFKDVTASATATALALPAMFSPFKREDFDLNEALASDNLLDLLKRAGLKVIWLDNDNGCKKVCDRVENIKLKPNDDPRYCDGNSCYDEILVDRLKAILPTVKSQTLIVLHAIGSHGPSYFKRYPPEFRVFRPFCDSAGLENCPNEAIVNSYDNSILYTDKVVDLAIMALKERSDLITGLTYVSDHGESLGEKGLYLHGIPYAFAPYEQLNVPLILWLSQALQAELRLDYACLKNFTSKPYSHDYLFHSLASALGLETKLYDESLDIFKPCRRKEASGPIGSSP
ncbi:MAG: phosphoethanolamine--lipid A transferase [Deltaproteobacteria bacterium]|jgi:lipid A ethanolaminephosphotransferase|nr:phosphoethanolamine--lipid A transferase [Deltaproteobacteria bacterium]